MATIDLLKIFGTKEQTEINNIKNNFHLIEKKNICANEILYNIVSNTNIEFIKSVIDYYKITKNELFAVKQLPLAILSNCENEPMEILHYIIQQYSLTSEEILYSDINGYNILYYCIIKQNNYTTLEYLLNIIDINKKDMLKTITTKKIKSCLFNELIIYGDIKTIDLFIDKYDLTINDIIYNQCDYNALHSAAMTDMEIIEYLFNKFDFTVTDVNHRNHLHLMPIHIVYYKNEGNIEMLKFFVEKGNITYNDLLYLPNSTNCTILRMLMKNWDITGKYLLKYIKINLFDDADIMLQNNKKETILFDIVRNNDNDLILYLIDKKIIEIHHVLHISNHNKTPLYCAAANDNYIIVKLFIESFMITKKDISLKLNKSYSTLMIAIVNKNYDIIEFLFKYYNYSMEEKKEILSNKRLVPDIVANIFIK